MKLAIFDTKKAKTGDAQLPQQFAEPVREDLIRRAVHALQAAARQAYGADPEAGKRSSAELSRRRRKYRGSYGQGISRVPRKILSRRGNRMYMVGAFAPGTVGGRRAHPPKAEKEWAQKINKRENRKAIRSALAATMDAAIVKARGHKVPDTYPCILDTSFEQLTKTSTVEKALSALGFDDELARSEKRKIRAGKATMRGRRHKRAISLLLVTGTDDVALIKSAKNVAGLTVVPVASLNAELLAPGTHPGRATLFTQSALAVMEKEKLFLDSGRKPQVSLRTEAEPKKSVKPAKKTEMPKKEETKDPAAEKKAAPKPEPKAEEKKASPKPVEKPAEKVAPEQEAKPLETPKKEVVKPVEKPKAAEPAKGEAA